MASKKEAKKVVEKPKEKKVVVPKQKATKKVSKKIEVKRDKYIIKTSVTSKDKVIGSTTVGKEVISLVKFNDSKEAKKTKPETIIETKEAKITILKGRKGNEEKYADQEKLVQVFYMDNCTEKDGVDEIVIIERK